ncbi:hypothetical protein GCM10017691_00600 [Pseudonocardia petroleophila]|uniref:DUF397 domain-containing protein n=1 Tax=Pseudonocardia petroleophila TaxID=37331 RepID=A0A7G7MLH4_9PSEU|nr:DUF397 domain-containing protein [Pseudonocardia petroleophila]QNG53635.1 DUF397 domain-containing protein [Pseudonocardia petroleophila]
MRQWGRPYFKKSSFCSVGTCVEVAIDPERGVRVRDAKLTDGPELSFTPDEWAAFLLGVRAGEFDL